MEDADANASAAECCEGCPRPSGVNEQLITIEGTVASVAWLLAPASCQKSRQGPKTGGGTRSVTGQLGETKVRRSRFTQGMLSPHLATRC